MLRRAGLVVVVGCALVAGQARADHTAQDARRTTAKLEAILHPPKKKAALKHERAVAPAPPAKVAAADADPFWDAIAYGVRLAVDGRTLDEHLRNLPKTPDEVEAHLRNIPKTPDEVAAHLRRLDAALARKR